MSANNILPASRPDRTSQSLDRKGLSATAPEKEIDSFCAAVKAQIESTPGICPRKRDRYRVVLGDKVLGECLTIDEALKLAKQGVSANG